MARTLTAGAATAKEARYAAFNLLLEAPSIGLYYSLAPTNAGGHTWEQRFYRGGLGEIAYTVEPGFGCAAPTQFQILCVDDGTGQSLSSIETAGSTFQGASVTFSFLFDGEDYADKIVLFRGEIEEYRRDGMVSELLMADELYRKDDQHPTAVVDRLTYPNADPSAEGRPIPTLYGTWPLLDPVPTLLIDTTDGEGRYKFSSQPMQSLNPGQLTGWGPTNPDARIAVPSFGGRTFDSATATIRLGSSISQTHFGNQGAANYYVQRQLDVVNAANAIDGNSNTWADIRVLNNTSGTDGYGNLGISGDWVAPRTPEGKDSLFIKLSRMRASDAAPSTIYLKITVRLIDAAGAVIRAEVLQMTNLRWFSEYRDLEFLVPEFIVKGTERAEIFFEVFNEGTTGQNVGWRVADVGFFLGHFTRGTNPAIFILGDWSGRPDDALGTYTGTPNLVMNNPAEVVWQLAVEDVALLYDAASVPAARTEYGLAGAEWPMAPTIGHGWPIERLTAREWLDVSAKHSKAIIIDSADGYRLVPYNATRAPVYAFTLATIYWSAGTLPSTPPINRQSTFRRDAAKQIPLYNHFEIRYRWNAAMREYDQQVFVDETGTNNTRSDAATFVQLCANSVAKHGKQPVFTYEAPFAFEGRHAENMLVEWVNYFTEKRVVAEFETGTQGLHLELGDFVTINHPDLSPPMRGTTPFEIHQLRYRFNTVTSPDGAQVLAFRTYILCSAKRAMGAFEGDAFEDDAFEIC